MIRSPMLLVSLTTVRFLLNVALCRIALGLCGSRLWRGAGLVLAADGAIALFALGLLRIAVRTRFAAPLRDRPYVVLAIAAVALIAALLIWEAAIRLAARPASVAHRRVGAAAAGLLITAAALSLAALLSSTTTGSRAATPARVLRRDVSVAGLPPAFDGLRVACVGDLHVSVPAPARGVRARLRPLRSLKPDVILFLGDYATGWSRFEDQAARIVAEHKAPMGAYAALGNHERWLGQAHSLRALRAAGVRVLVNEKVVLKRGASRLYLAGVNDPYTGADDLDAALRGVPRDACVILMSHSPDIIARAKARRIALVVAAHTHGGQISLPLVGPPVVNSRYGSKYAAGLFYEGETAMFVTRGVGEVFPFFRFNCPREIALLRLAAAAQSRGQGAGNRQ